MGVGKSNAKVYVEKQTGVTFKDVAGQDEARGSPARASRNLSQILLVPMVANLTVPMCPPIVRIWL